MTWVPLSAFVGYAGAEVHDLNRWARAGYVPVRTMRPGKWQPRYVEDVLVAQAMCVLAAAGLRLDMAAALARRWADGEDPLYAGDGVVLHLTLPPLDLSEWLPSG